MFFGDSDHSSKGHVQENKMGIDITLLGINSWHIGNGIFIA